MKHTLAWLGLATCLISAAAVAQNGNTTAAPERAAVAAAIDKAGAYAFNSDRSVADVDPSDGRAMTAFLTGLTTNARSDLTTRCGTILSDPTNAAGPAGPFCRSLKSVDAANTPAKL